ncbi:hypothetical protein O1611_g3311 [Lasiodiplodia mahajangana]|uniref:Uncharacterized protein n=1 Tax=Lasiodiplodia mahajangana TaxID=1108764 RepID=A0ACC2JSB9_9PEZI|nr:hypothetical protein O1611_g3311 [Lasiodiplodia mahajangana]
MKFATCFLSVALATAVTASPIGLDSTEEDGSGSSPGAGKVAIGAFLLPNAPIPNEKPLADFEVPIEAIERASGLEFASKLPPQRRKRLCADTSCALIIKDYADKQKAFKSSSPGPNAGALVKGSGGR